MDSAKAHQSAMSDRSRSLGPDPPYREFMEDADSSATRKRPRLDSGDRSYRSMSADGPQTSSQHTAWGVLPSKKDSNIPADPFETLQSAPPPTVQPNKVTINLRDPSTAPTTASQDTSAEESRNAAHYAQDQLADASYHRKLSEVVSVTSSPMHSPEIEVAEIEDIDGESTHTRWRPLGGTDLLEAKNTQEQLLLGFPCLERSSSLRKALSILTTVLDKQDLSVSHILGDLASWITIYLQATEPLKSYWYELLGDHRDFWDGIPNLVQQLLRRNTLKQGTIRWINSVDDDPSNDDNQLHNFLVSFTALSLRMAQIDEETLRDFDDDSTSSPDLVSENYLICLAHSLTPNANFWKATVDLAYYDIMRTRTAMIRRFAFDGVDGVSCLAEKIKRQDFYQEAVWASSAIICDVLHYYQECPGSERAHVASVTTQAFEYFLDVDIKVKAQVKNQRPALSINACSSIIPKLYNILLYACLADRNVTAKCLSQLVPASPAVTIEEEPWLVYYAWKFELLKRCVMEGRMEIRVFGVDSMQSELVEIYNKYSDKNVRDRELITQPIALYLSDWMLTNRILEYLVGVDSHPQITTRSSNIIGFLVVTNKYSSTETDIIWNAVANGQDSRHIEAILRMLRGIFDISPFDLVMYLVVKLNEIPLQSFYGTMMDHARDLMKAVREKKSKMPDFSMAMPPYDLCIRLMRESSTDDSLGPQRRQDVRQWVGHELRCMLDFGPTDSHLEQIYDDCLDSVSRHTANATGSVFAISSLFNHSRVAKHVKRLAEASDLTRLLVSDIAYTIALQQQSNTINVMVDESLTIRLHLLQQLTLLTPDSISYELAKDTWEVIVGSRAINDAAREQAWAALMAIMHNSAEKGLRNSFIDLCINEFLPQLQPGFVVYHCLAFACAVNNYHAKTIISACEESGLTTSVDLLWHLSLAIPEIKRDLEARSINMLIAQYLDSPEAHKRSRSESDAIHIDLAQRCINQLHSAASKLESFSLVDPIGEDDTMISVTPSEQREEQKLLFARSLRILSAFVQMIRERPMYSPEPQPTPQLPKGFCEIKGNPIKILYQAFSGRSNTEIRTIEVGSLETRAELADRLRLLTGFSSFNAIAGGQPVDFVQQAEEKLEEADLHRKGLLLIKRAAITNATHDLASTYGLRPVEIEIMAHFSDLYRLLALDEELAEQVYMFLCAFPPHQSTINLVCTQGTPTEDAFPSSAPFKMLYSIHALKRCLSQYSDDDAASQPLIAHSILILTSAITRFDLQDRQISSKVGIAVAAALVECLLAFMREPGAFSEANNTLPDPSQLVDQLHSWTAAGLGSSQNSFEAKMLVDQCFAALLEASMHSAAFRTSFVAATKLPSLLERLLLEEPGLVYQKETALMMEGTCCKQQKSPAAPRELISYLWDSIVVVIPRCLEYDGKTQYFFNTARAFLMATLQDDERRPHLDVNGYLHVWCNILLRHVHVENVGRDEIDWTLIGLARLIYHCLQPPRPLNQSPSVPDNFMEALLRTHLFPDPPAPSEAPLSIPTLHTSVREELVMIVLALSNEQSNHETLVQSLRALMPEDGGSQAWSWGLAQPMDDYPWEPCFSIERSRIIRSPSGYAGLRNLTNTCYMNSLLSQLFMNVEFRRFMFSTQMSDASHAQRLLHETRHLFSYLQETHQKAVNTQGIVDSLVTYDNTNIDVTIQMDVDEFYNLLFDRWESQIIGDDDRKLFRSFYGGQIVQQIKSKECSHISERLEPFSAIQCDITGKTTLIESLEAYVSGEIMEGDNKYSCTSCGSYVDAVKRACFKDIPNNLIFHLKRFDYDLMTGQRSKINSRFEFPKEIDMTPYHVDQLRNDKEEASADVFQLVGVLVHSGTAESGHYYSYIQKRSARSGPREWFEFNDMEVSSFDPRNIDDQCFGGWVDPTSWVNGYMKIWNAYMLFYERIDAETQKHPPPEGTLPNADTDCLIPSEFCAPINLHNVDFLRRYCWLDDAQAILMVGLLRQLRTVYDGSCTSDHTAEKDIIELCLEFMDRFQSRTKGCPRYEELLATMTEIVTSCPGCCTLALDWLACRESSLRNLLLRCPVGRVRGDFANMMAKGLRYLRHGDPSAYGFQEPDDTGFDTLTSPLVQIGGIFPAIASALKNVMQLIHHHSKSWDDYFGLMAQLALMGISEKHALVSRGFLQSCMEILLVEDQAARSNLRLGHGAFVRLLEKGRKFPMEKLADLTAVLLDGIDLRLHPVDANIDERPLVSNHMPPSELEDDYLRYDNHHTPRGKASSILLERMLNVGSTLEAIRLVVRKMVLAEPKFGMLGPIRLAIQNCISVDPAWQAGPALHAALTFCECAPTPKSSESMVVFVCQELDSIGKSGGAEHLQFFNDARRLRNIRLEDSDFFLRLVRSKASVWAPPLLSYVDELVRSQTVELLNDLLFCHETLDFDDEELANEINDAGKRLCQACARKCADKLSASKQLDSPKSWEQIIEVARICINLYYPEDEEIAAAQISSILNSMESLSVSDLEDAPSEKWANSADEVPSESESDFENNSV